MIQFYPKGWHDHVGSQNRWLNEKWFDAHGLSFDPNTKPISYDTEARLLTYGKDEMPVKTPPIWVAKNKAVFG